ncbi:MAG TPA: glycosyltransferase [Planctomycetota bacterium]
MRICQVVHGFPPVERTGVENYTLGLSRALARAGHRVEVFVPRRDPQLADLALRREEREGFAVNWITNNNNPQSPREALLVPELKRSFAAFLERERPEVVHFQHLIKLGLDLVSVARERGIPTVFTAHDYYPICHRFTLLRPDLARCDVRGDSRACARCDLALGLLNAQPNLGDYQVGVLRDQLDPAAWGKLEGILADRGEEHGLTQAEIEAACEQRGELDRLRREAYTNFDLVLAPSRFLIEELVRGGFARERIEHSPLGFEVADLAGLPPVRPDPARPVRFAFLGGVAKHKGVHVLLEAFARLPGGAELAVWGGSTDRVYVEHVRRRAGEVGAQWRGSYERADLPRILAEVDAVVVPSIWVENFPLVIHEAFAAGRPVLTSRLGALAEIVHDGSDGLLAEPGDVEDLARVLRRCVEEAALLPALARGAPPVKSMATEARELAGRYAELVGTRRVSRDVAGLPPSLATAVGRHDELTRMPSRELFARVLAGLDELRRAWTPELGGIEAVELLARGLGEGSEAQDRLREARNEIAWLRTKKEELDEGREELVTLFEDLDQLLNETRAGSQRQAEHLDAAGSYVRKKEAEVLDAHARIQELEQVIAEKDRYIREVEGHVHEAGRYIRHKEGEYTDVETELRRAAEERRALQDELQATRERTRALEAEAQAAGGYARAKEGEARQLESFAREKEAEALAAGGYARAKEGEARQLESFAREKEAEALAAGETLARREQELGAARERGTVLDLRTRTVADVSRLALQAQERLLNRALRPILTHLHALHGGTAPLELPSESASFGELLQATRDVERALEVLGDELEWLRPMRAELELCRARMERLQAAYSASGLLRLALARTALGRELRAWREEAAP